MTDGAMNADAVNGGMAGDGRADIKIEGARFVLTLDPGRRIIADGALLIRGGRIAAVGKTAEFADVPAGRVIDASEMVVTPGFCNAHAHISYGHATRGIFPDELGADYLPNVFALQAAMTEEEEHCASLLAITEMLKGGVTCFLDPGSTKHLDACMSAYERAGCRIIVGAHLTDAPNPLGLPTHSAADGAALMERVVREYDGRLGGRVRAWAMPFDAAYCSDELLRAAKRIADDYGVGMTLHQTNGDDAVADSVAKYGMRPVERLEAIGVLGENTLLSHVIGVDGAEMDAMARTGTKAVMCPSQTLKQGSGIGRRGRLPEMLARGICVALGTDAPNNSNLMETMRAMYLAAVIYKDAREDQSMVPPETALELATLRGAEAFGLADEIGSVEVGKRADLVLFDTRRAEWRTLFNPVNNLVYNADGRSVHTVIVDGRVAVENHKALFVDEWALIQRAQTIGEDMLARTGVSFPTAWPVV